MSATAFTAWIEAITKKHPTGIAAGVSGMVITSPAATVPSTDMTCRGEDTSTATPRIGNAIPIGDPQPRTTLSKGDGDR